MADQKRASVGTVRLYPVLGAFIDGEPAVEREVSAKEADRLLSFDPPAFARSPSAKPVAVEADVDAEPQE